MRGALYRAWAALRTPALLRRLEDLDRSQWLSPAEVASAQMTRLRDLLSHAGRTVPYYRRVFREAGLDPARVRSLEDLRRLPPLQRETLAERFEDLRSDRPRASSRPRATGGSTGRMARFLVDERDLLERSAHLYRNLSWFGWRLGDRLAFLWGSDVDSREHRGLAGGARDTLAGVLWLDAFSVREDRLGDHLDRLESFAPRVLIGYPSSLHLLASHALASGRRLRLEGVQTSAEVLSPRVRRDLEEVFGAKVLDRYGCREIGIAAHECPSGGMHVNAEAVVMECVEGEVLLTSLNNYAMPLIRYRNEDLAEMDEGTCRCGRGLPLVRAIRGRISDVLRTPGGRLVHGEFFTHLLYEERAVSRFQVVQTAPDRLEIRVVADAGFDEAARARVGRAIREHADATFVVSWISVPDLPAGPSGKFRFVIPHAASADRGD